MPTFLDIGDISPFSYFKEFEKIGGNVPISENGEVYSGTLYQNNNEYQTVQVVNPSKNEDESKEDKEESAPDAQPIFYYKGAYEEYKDPSPPKQDDSGQYSPSKPQVFTHILIKQNIN